MATVKYVLLIQIDRFPNSYVSLVITDFWNYGFHLPQKKCSSDLSLIQQGNIHSAMENDQTHLIDYKGDKIKIWKVWSLNLSIWFSIDKMSFYIYICLMDQCFHFCQLAWKKFCVLWWKKFYWSITITALCLTEADVVKSSNQLEVDQAKIETALK